MRLIADSGSTKTDWALTDGNRCVARIATQGINPVHMDEHKIADIIGETESALEKMLGTKPDVEAIDFYGAGCVLPYKDKIFAALKNVFRCDENHICVESDLLGAARAVCGEQDGIVCILGTGSNSCVYDGRKIVSNIPPLGYILGDEGSGAAIGKRFLNALFKEELSPALREDFLQSQQLTYADIIEQVYRRPMANRFLAGLSLYVGTRMQTDDDDAQQLREMVAGCFAEFFEKNILRYGREYASLPIGAVGSIAWHYQDIFRATAQHYGYDVGMICQAPMDGLLKLTSKTI